MLGLGLGLRLGLGLKIGLELGLGLNSFDLDYANLMKIMLIW